MDSSPGFDKSGSKKLNSEKEKEKLMRAEKLNLAVIYLPNDNIFASYSIPGHPYKDQKQKYL